MNEEKDYALKDYNSKISGQQKSIQMLQREHQELERLIGNKDQENGDMRIKIDKFRDKTGHIGDEYGSSRETNDD